MFNPLTILNIIKAKIKLKRFKKKALGCSNLSVSPLSNIIKDNDSQIKIGDSCDIQGTILSLNGGTLSIGDYTTIRMNSMIGCADKIEIGSYVIISNNVHIYDNNNHPTDPTTRKEMCLNGFYGEAWSWTHATKKPTIIEDNVWIGERSTILKGVTIGEGSIVACDSVVTKSVPPFSLIAGNPAKVVKSLK